MKHAMRTRTYAMLVAMILLVFVEIHGSQTQTIPGQKTKQGGGVQSIVILDQTHP